MKIVVAGVGALLMVLVGCAPTTGSSPTAAPTASPSATGTLASAPVPALPLTCSQLFTIGAVQSHLHNDVSAKVDEAHVGEFIQDLAVLQAGGTECTWGGVNMTDSSYDTGVVVDILPDAAADFAARKLPTGGNLVSGTMGDSSAYVCPEGGQGWCFGDVLAGGYWITFELGDADGPQGSSGAAVEAIMKPLAVAVAKAGGSVSNWAKPTKLFEAAALCTAPTASALVSSTLGTAVTVSSYSFDGLLGAAATREGVVNCVWSSGNDQQLAVSVLPAGSWVFPLAAAAPPLWTLIGHPTPIDVPGSDGALSGCGDACEALVNIQNSVMLVGMDSTQDQATATTITQKLIAGIPAQ